MRLLAYDTSSANLSAGIFEGSQPVAVIELENFVRHSSTLAPVLARLTNKARTPWKDIEGIAVGIGPGSFTGLRVGVTTAQVLAYALKKKVLGVPSQEALAHCVTDRSGLIVVISDAKKGQLYASIFKKSAGQLHVMKGPYLTDIERLLSELEEPAFFMGEGVPLCRERISHFKKYRCRIAPDSYRRYPSAQGVARAAANLVHEKKFTKAALLRPLYLYPRDCNVIQK